MLATVQGIATETLRAPPGTGGLIPAAAKTAFEARLAALGRSHEVLMREDGAKADLSELVNLVLAPHAAGRPARATPPAARRSGCRPPWPCRFPWRCTNWRPTPRATAPSASPEGSVAVTWRLEEVGPGHAPMLRLRWEERGGPQLDGPAAPPRLRPQAARIRLGAGDRRAGVPGVPHRLVCEIEAPLKAAARAATEAV
jgi:two-component system CheB/CheR fusion protein